MQRYEASISIAERALREQQYLLLIQSLNQLPEAFEVVETIRARLQEKIKRTEQFSRQADLLLLQSPLDTQLRRFHYTMLMRTASEPGSHGINIQDSSTLVEQDRVAMREVIQQVTDAIDRGLAREFAVRRGGSGAPAMAASDATTTPPDDSEAITAPAADVPRRFDVEEEEGLGGNPLQLNTLLQNMGDLMFRLFMPDWTQRYLQDTPCALMITTNDLELPWELMYCNGNYLCLERPISRMPMGRALPRLKPKSAVMDGRKLRFLLIYSDPENTLPSAGTEINTLNRHLNDEWKDRIEVIMLDRQQVTGARLNEELRLGSFDVIHYAGHASFDNKSPELSGLLVADREGRKEVFFAQKIRRLLEGRPLVFLNACQSGRTANEEAPLRTDYLLEPAEGLASAFLYGGALACIGSLWPIYDKPAAEFAVEFYRRALEGYMLGEAMRLARIETRRKYPEQITWAAFALYGDATFRLAH